MKISVGIGNALTAVAPETLPHRAVRAEQLGFASIATVGRIALPAVMDTVALAAAAGATRRIGLFTGVLIAPAWTPIMLAKELASIDAVSGHRLSVGLGLGSRQDDYPDGRPQHRGRRLDDDVSSYAAVWRGDLVDQAAAPLVPDRTRQIPLLFGGVSAPAMRRMARSGAGYVGASLPPERVEALFTDAVQAWDRADRDQPIRLVALAYSALTAPDAGLATIAEYYRDRPVPLLHAFLDGVNTDADQLRRTAERYERLGVDEFFVNPSVPGEGEVEAIAATLLA